MTRLDRKFQRERASVEQRRKALDNACDEIAQLHNRWQKRLSFKDLRLAERYIDMELGGIGIVLRHHFGGHSEQFVAVFQRETPAAGLEQDRRHVNRLPVFPGCGQTSLKHGAEVKS